MALLSYDLIQDIISVADAYAEKVRQRLIELEATDRARRVVVQTPVQLDLFECPPSNA